MTESSYGTAYAPAPTARQFLRTIEHELAKFEKCEREFVARERRERADQFGLPIFGLREPKRLSQSGDTVA